MYLITTKAGSSPVVSQTAVHDEVYKTAYFPNADVLCAAYRAPMRIIGIIVNGQLILCLGWWRLQLKLRWPTPAALFLSVFLWQPTALENGASTPKGTGYATPGGIVVPWSLLYFVTRLCYMYSY